MQLEVGGILQNAPFVTRQIWPTFSSISLRCSWKSSTRPGFSSVVISKIFQVEMAAQYANNEMKRQEPQLQRFQCFAHSMQHEGIRNERNGLFQVAQRSWSSHWKSGGKHEQAVAWFLVWPRGDYTNYYAQGKKEDNLDYNSLSWLPHLTLLTCMLRCIHHEIYLWLFTKSQWVSVYALRHLWHRWNDTIRDLSKEFHDFQKVGSELFCFDKAEKNTRTEESWKLRKAKRWSDWHFSSTLVLKIVNSER